LNPGKGKRFIRIFSENSTRNLGLTQTLILLVPGDSFCVGKPLPREANHSSPSSAEVKNYWRYTFPPPYAFLACIWTNHFLRLSVIHATIKNSQNFRGSTKGNVRTQKLMSLFVVFRYTYCIFPFPLGAQCSTKSHYISNTRRHLPLIDFKRDHISG